METTLLHNKFLVAPHFSGSVAAPTRRSYNLYGLPASDSLNAKEVFKFCLCIWKSLLQQNFMFSLFFFQKCKMLFFRRVLQSSARPSLLPITIHPSLSLAQCYLNPSPREWTFHSCMHGWKGKRLHPHNSQVCFVTSWTCLVIRNDLVTLHFMNELFTVAPCMDENSASPCSQQPGMFGNQLDLPGYQKRSRRLHILLIFHNQAAQDSFLFTNRVNRACVTLWPCHLLWKSILWQMKNYGNKDISPCKNLIFKKSSKRNQNPSRYYNSMTNLKFQHKPKYHPLKNPHIKIDLLLLPRGQNPLSYYTL